MYIIFNIHMSHHVIDITHTQGMIPSPNLGTPPGNHGLVGNFHTIGTI